MWFVWNGGRGCIIADEGAAHIFRGLAKNKSVTDMDVANVPLGHFALKSLCQVLSANSTLQKLNIWGCGIGSGRAELLFPGLKDNKSLTEVACRLDSLLFHD